MGGSCNPTPSAGHRLPSHLGGRHGRETQNQPSQQPHLSVPDPPSSESVIQLYFIASSLCSQMGFAPLPLSYAEAFTNLGCLLNSQNCIAMYFYIFEEKKPQTIDLGAQDGCSMKHFVSIDSGGLRLPQATFTLGLFCLNLQCTFHMRSYGM